MMQLVAQVIIYVLLFATGILSFFSPGVINAAPAHDDASRPAPARFLGFTLGALAALLVLGLICASVGTSIKTPRLLVIRVAGVVVIALALLQLMPARAGIFQREVLLPQPQGSSFGAALGRGVRLILGWVPHFTPLVLIALAFALSMGSTPVGMVAVAAFAAGLGVMLIGSGLSQTRSPQAFKRRVWLLRHSANGAGVIGLLMGFMLLTGWMNSATSYLTPVTPTPTEATVASETASEEVGLSVPQAYVTAPDFTLVDQNGMTHTLSDYQGDIVVIMFWSTRSQAATSGLRDFQTFYNEVLRQEQEKLAQQAASAASASATSASADGQPSAAAAPSEAPGPAGASSTPSASTASVAVLSVVLPNDELPESDAEAAPGPAAGSSAAAAPPAADTASTAQTTAEQRRSQLIAALSDTSLEQVEAYISENGYTFPVLMDMTGGVFMDYGVTELPTTYVLTTDGKIAGKVSGVLTANQLRHIVQEGVTVSDQIVAEEQRAAAAASSASTAAASANATQQAETSAEASN